MFENEDSNEVFLKLVDLDLKVEQNEKLIKLISDEDIESIEEEIQFEVFKLAKKLKRKKITKSNISSLKRSSNFESQQELLRTTPSKHVSIQFCCNYESNRIMMIFDVNTGSTVDQLTERVKAERRARNLFSPILALKYKNELMTGSLMQYNLQDGDTICYITSDNYL